MSWRIATAVGCFALLAQFGLAGPPAIAQQASGKDCTCRFNGSDYHLGEIVCLRTNQGPQLAQCDMVLNNTSWSLTGRSCTISLNVAPQTAKPSQIAANQK